MDLEYNVNVLKESYSKFNFLELDVRPKYMESMSGRKSEAHYLIEVDVLCPCGRRDTGGFVLNEIGLFEWGTQKPFSEEILIEHLREDGLL